MLSLLKQNENFQNFHIVYLDDYSSDGTLTMAKSFMDKRHWPKDRITYIQNLQRRYTEYNTQHAAHSYCRADDIQITLDGDDRLIGNYVLTLLNALYLKNPNHWVIYSNYISTRYTYG